MVITILAEPRSGSTNLAYWFSMFNSFTIFQEPLNKQGISYQKNKPIHNWQFKTEHLLIKEIYNPDIDLKEILQYSDKVILLYRENYSEQIESWLVASVTNSWISNWVQDRVYIDNFETRVNYFKKLKEGFKEDFINTNTYFKISYEELYYNNGFQKILNYLDIEELENKNFPYGQKYRVNIDSVRNLI
jgi:hypothetical protein